MAQESVTASFPCTISLQQLRVTMVGLMLQPQPSLVGHALVPQVWFPLKSQSELDARCCRGRTAWELVCLWLVDCCHICLSPSCLMSLQQQMWVTTVGIVPPPQPNLIGHALAPQVSLYLLKHSSGAMCYWSSMAWGADWPLQVEFW